MRTESLGFVLSHLQQFLLFYEPILSSVELDKFLLCQKKSIPASYALSRILKLVGSSQLEPNVIVPIPISETTIC